MKRNHRVEKVKSEGHVHLFVYLTLKWDASSHASMNNSYSCEEVTLGSHDMTGCITPTVLYWSHNLFHRNSVPAANILLL